MTSQCSYGNHAYSLKFTPVTINPFSSKLKIKTQEAISREQPIIDSFRSATTELEMHLLAAWDFPLWIIGDVRFQAPGAEVIIDGVAMKRKVAIPLLDTFASDQEAQQHYDHQGHGSYQSKCDGQQDLQVGIPGLGR